MIHCWLTLETHLSFNKIPSVISLIIRASIFVHLLLRLLNSTEEDLQLREVTSILSQLVPIIPVGGSLNSTVRLQIKSQQADDVEPKSSQVAKKNGN